MYNIYWEKICNYSLAVKLARKLEWSDSLWR